jgi:hypothetical protein
MQLINILIFAADLKYLYKVAPMKESTILSLEKSGSPSKPQRTSFRAADPSRSLDSYLDRAVCCLDPHRGCLCKNILRINHNIVTLLSAPFRLFLSPTTSIRLSFLVFVFLLLSIPFFHHLFQVLFTLFISFSFQDLQALDSPPFLSFLFFSSIFFTFFSWILAIRSPGVDVFLPDKAKIDPENWCAICESSKSSRTHHCRRFVFLLEFEFEFEFDFFFFFFPFLDAIIVFQCLNITVFGLARALGKITTANSLI